ATAVCELVYRAVLDGSSAVSLRGWLGVAAAVATFEVVTTCTIVLVVGLVTGRFATGSMVGAGVTALLNMPLSAILAVVATTVIWQHAAVGGLLVVVSGGTAGFGYRAYQALSRRHQRLDTLYGYTRRLSDLSDRVHVLTATLQQAGELLNATTAELMVIEASGTTRYFLDPAGRLLTDTDARTGALEAMALDAGAVLAARHDRTPRITAALAERRVADAVAVSLPSGTAQEVLVVADRPASRDTFDDHDLEMLQTLAAHSGVAIRNTRLLEQLRDQVSAREHESLHDSLTGLPNRVLFARWTDEALRQRSEESMVAIMIIDLDGFKEINDTLGHLTGD
ncbi:MAG: diguanylate cyclase domain-containing protein, partial [Acidimicrobiales bacterium]